MARKFYTDEEKAKHMALWEASGMTRKRYATSNGINSVTFYKWFKKEHEDSANESSKDFVEIRKLAPFEGEAIKIRKAGIEIEVSFAAFEKVMRVLVSI